MASIRKRGTSYRVELARAGLPRESATFPTKREAAQWALQREAELTGRRLPDKTLADALDRYGTDIAPTHKGARWELVRCNKLATYPIAQRTLATLEGHEFATWRDARLADVKPASVAREMTLLRSVLEECRLHWGWLRVNPMTDVKKPPSPASRKRRVSSDEADRIALACGLDEDRADTATQRTGLAFAFALETAMRAGEIVGLMWPEVAEKSVRLPETKNGDVRHVPLSKRAREILAALPVTDGPVFGLLSGTRDVMFRRARDAAKIPGLHFHDSRAEAIWRLSKKLDVLELARVIGHRDLRSLQLYYQIDADELADRL